jgi:hypothetical protein
MLLLLLKWLTVKVTGTATFNSVTHVIKHVCDKSFVAVV